MLLVCFFFVFLFFSLDTAHLAKTQEKKLKEQKNLNTSISMEEFFCT